jgi:glycoside/pentoside/hexuronide:cation symporter, GPH family
LHDGYWRFQLHGAFVARFPPPLLTAMSETRPVSRRLPSWVVAAASAPALPMTALALPMSVYLPEFYGNALGVPLAAVGLTFTVVRLLDIGVDPVIGTLMDRTRSPWGRFKPWLVGGIPLVILGVLVLFYARPGAGVFHLGAGLLLAYGGYSVIMLAQLALASTLSTDYNERSRIFGWWSVFNIFGQLVATMVPSLLASRFGRDPASLLAVMGVVIMAVTPLTVLWALLGVREPPGAAQAPRPRVALEDYINLLRLKSTRIVLTIDLLIGLAIGISSSAFVFFLTIIKQLDRVEIGLMLGFQMLAGALSTPFWIALSKRMQKHHAFFIAALLHSAGAVVWGLMPPQNIPVYALGSFLNGIGYAAGSLLPRAMMADINDEEVLARGVDRAGLLYSMLIGIYKIGQAVSVGLAFTILGYLGFVAKNGAANSALALNGVAVLYAWIPAALSFTAGMVVLAYPLTAARHAEIRRELDARAALPAQDGAS